MEIWASEIVDEKSCDACKAVDGKDYNSEEEARADYPNGYYKNCEHGENCRGTLAIIT